MKRGWVLAGVAAAVAAAAVVQQTVKQRGARAEVAAASAAADPKRDPYIVAAGRVEPASEEIQIASEIAGRLRQVPVEEGQRVRKGQVLAVVENEDYRARLALSEAQLQAREAELRRVLAGARDQERREAAAAVSEARAVMANARAEMERRRALHASGDISRSEADRTEREHEVAKARYEAAVQRHSFVDARARDEDRDRAAAEVAAARAQVQLNRAYLDKTIIRAPISGIVLRKHLKAGESVSDGPDTVILTIADDGVLRVRVDVDETDVAKVKLGQKAWVTADAYGDRRFHGRVVRVAQILGRKNIRTDEPVERVDTKVLETLVELDPGERLPAGLRVTARLAAE